MASIYVYTTKALGEADNMVCFTCWPRNVPGSNTGYDVATLHVNELEVDDAYVAEGAVHTVDFNETNDGFVVSEPAIRPKGA